MYRGLTDLGQGLARGIERRQDNEMTADKLRKIANVLGYDKSMTSEMGRGELDGLISADIMQFQRNNVNHDQTRLDAQNNREQMTADRLASFQRNQDAASAITAQTLSQFYQTPQSMRAPNLDPFLQSANKLASAYPAESLRMFDYAAQRKTAEAASALNTQKSIAEINKANAETQRSSRDWNPAFMQFKGDDGNTYSGVYTPGTGGFQFLPQDKTKALDPMAQNYAPTKPLLDPQTGQIVPPTIQQQAADNPLAPVITVPNPAYTALVARLKQGVAMPTETQAKAPAEAIKPQDAINLLGL